VHPEAAEPVRRAVVLGASNVTRGMASLAANASALLGEPLELLVAAGRGRSYGTWSRVLARSLPSILDSGVWAAARSGAAPTHALITDIGNDLMYGRTPETLLAWVEEALTRLDQLGARTALARLPMARLERLSPVGYSILRRTLFAQHQPPPFQEALARARAVHAGIAELAARHGATIVDPSLTWYGADPIHLCVSRHAVAWRGLLAPWAVGSEREDTPPVVARWSATARLARALPQQGRMFGCRFGGATAEVPGVRLGGTRVRLF
jgi:hypothetical protein